VAKLCGCVLCLLLLAAMPLPAQAPGISDTVAQIRAEETNNSKVMWIHPRGRGCVRPARDGHTELEGGRRLGRQDDDVVGIGERAP